MDGPDCPYPPPGLPHPAHDPGPHVTPGAVSPCPRDASTWLGFRSPQPCPAQPWALPSCAHPQDHIPAWPWLFSISREVPDAQGWGCPGALQLPCSWLGLWNGTDCQALPRWAIPMQNLHSQGDRGPCCALTVGCFHCHTYPVLRNKLTGYIVLTNNALWGQFAASEGKCCSPAEV